ncbi:MAG: hypothetical protein O2999_07490 [Nitrospirae bacterium]|nr:hypothetical protein [Nitrospirota bacterium]MDA1304128.1 hypothetical protein [Nitrospirota bacterium]
MKEKLSVTVEEPLVRFLDSLPGNSRSEKLEKVLRRFQDVSADVLLRKALARHAEAGGGREEDEAWSRTMEHDQWNESIEGTSGQSNL